MGIIERIKEIEAEMARTQKNKATGTGLHPLIFYHRSLPFTSCLYQNFPVLFLVRVQNGVFCISQNAEYHLGQLKAKIAKLRTQLLEPPKVRISYVSQCLLITSFSFVSYV